jgi:hypothetical protein
MNMEAVTNILGDAGLRRAILILFLAFSIVLAGYNTLYLSQSLHITARHMGIESPLYLKQVIKVGIFSSVVSAGFCLLLLLSGRY